MVAASLGGDAARDCFRPKATLAAFGSGHRYQSETGHICPFDKQA